MKLFSRVTPEMCVKPSQDGETPAALGAEVRFGVGQVVSLHHTLPAEQFITGRAFKRLGRLLFGFLP